MWPFLVIGALGAMACGSCWWLRSSGINGILFQPEKPRYSCVYEDGWRTASRKFNCRYWISRDGDGGKQNSGHDVSTNNIPGSTSSRSSSSSSTGGKRRGIKGRGGGGGDGAHHTAPLIIVYLHANAENANDGRQYLQQLQSLLNQEEKKTILVAPEYPGYGPDDYGRINPSVASSKRAAFRAVRAVMSGNPHSQVVLIGRSIGTGVTCWLANQIDSRRLQGLVLISPFVSISELAHDLAGSLGSIAPPVFTNDEELRRLSPNVPVLLIHGNSDRLISPRHSGRLAFLLGTKRATSLYIIPGGHNGLDVYSHPVKFINSSFIF